MVNDTQQTYCILEDREDGDMVTRTGRRYALAVSQNV